MHTEQITGRVCAAILLAVTLSGPAAAQSSSNDKASSMEDSFVNSEIVQSLYAAESSGPAAPAGDNYSTHLDEVIRLEGIPKESMTLTRTEWAAFGERIELALESSHTGLQHGALRLVIAYGDNIEMSEDAVFDVMRIYRNGQTERARRMAVVALAEMDSRWAIGFLNRSWRFEKSPLVRQTILAVLHDAQRNGVLL